MEFALILGPVFPPRDEMPSKAAFDLEMTFCKQAYTSGFEGVSVNHHYLVGPEAQCFQPIPLCGHILAKYPSLYVATTIFILPYHPPVEVAEQVATLDLMAPGKFILGIGQGYRTKEGDAVGIRNKERGVRLAESIKVMKMLWAEGPTDFSSEFFTLNNADIGPRPMRSSGPPILVAADKLHTIERIPRLGADHWLPSARHSLSFLREALPIYKRTVEETGRPFLGIPLQRDLCIGRDRKEAYLLVESSYERMLHMQSGWGQPGERYDVPFEELQRDRVILGSPEEAAEQLIALNKEFSAEFVLFRIYTPGMEPSLALEMIEQVGKEVLPLVRSEVGSASLFTS